MNGQYGHVARQPATGLTLYPQHLHLLPPNESGRIVHRSGRISLSQPHFLPAATTTTSATTDRAGTNRPATDFHFAIKITSARWLSSTVSDPSTSAVRERPFNKIDEHLTQSRSLPGLDIECRVRGRAVVVGAGVRTLVSMAGGQSRSHSTGGTASAISTSSSVGARRRQADVEAEPCGLGPHVLVLDAEAQQVGEPVADEGVHCEQLKHRSLVGEVKASACRQRVASGEVGDRPLLQLFHPASLFIGGRGVAVLFSWSTTHQITGRETPGEQDALNWGAEEIEP